MFKALRARLDFTTYVVVSLPASMGMFVEMLVLKRAPLEHAVWAQAIAVALVAVVLAFTTRTAIDGPAPSSWDMPAPYAMGCKHGNLFFRVKRKSDDESRWLVEVRNGQQGSWTRLTACILSTRRPTPNEVLDAYVLSRHGRQGVPSGH